MKMWRANFHRLSALLTFVAAFAFIYGPDALRMDLAPAALVSGGAALAVWFSGKRPIVALVVVVGATGAVVVTGSTFDAMPLVLLLVGFEVGMRTDFDLRFLAVVLLGALAVNDLWSRHLLSRPFAETSVVLPALMTALTVALGDQSRRVRRQNEELVALRKSERERAVLDERRRIARDVHDIAAHHLSALVVRNKLAKRNTSWRRHGVAPSPARHGGARVT